eukprot:4448458-Ditylum_brightwellii.AAC.1
MSHRDSRRSIDTQGKGRHSTQMGLQIANNTHNNMKENIIKNKSRTTKAKDLFRYCRRDNKEENRDRTFGHRGSNV